MKTLCCYSFRLALTCLLIASLAMLSGCPDDNPVGPKPGKLLLDTTINTSNNDAVVILSEKIKIIIPQGTVLSNTQLTIHETPLANCPSTSEIRVHKIYDVQLDTLTMFSKPLKITLYFKSTDLPSDCIKSNLRGAYYKDNLKRWSIFNETVIDTINNTLNFETTHLTKLGNVEYVTTGGYTDKFENANFIIYYCEKGSNAPMNNKDYNNETSQPWHVTSGPEVSTPFYVQDLAHWLTEVYQKYRYTCKFPLTDSKIIVYIKQLSGADGEFGSITGAVYINNKLVIQSDDPTFTIPEQLQSVAAHEMFHYCQDFYYVMNKGNFGLWWLEATAIQADRIVWGNTLKHYESIFWSMKQSSTYGHVLSYNLSKSWDDCAGSPYHYVAGCFLNYLSNYSDTKASISDLIKLGGKESDLSYFRTIIDTYLKTKNPLTNIGNEFKNYVQMLFEGQSAMSLIYTINRFVPNPDNKIEYPIVLTSSTKSITYNTALPYLSAKIIKLKNSSSDNPQVMVRCGAFPSGFSAILYTRNATTKKLEIERYLNSNDSKFIDLPKGTMKDILLINSTIGTKITPNIEFLYSDAQNTPINIDAVNLIYPTSDFNPKGVNCKMKITGNLLAPSISELKLDNVYGSTPRINIYSKAKDQEFKLNLQYSVSIEPVEFKDVFGPYSDTTFFKVDSVHFVLDSSKSTKEPIHNGKNNYDGTYNSDFIFNSTKNFTGSVFGVNFVIRANYYCTKRKHWYDGTKWNWTITQEEISGCALTVYFVKGY